MSFPKGEIFIIATNKNGDVKEVYYENLIVNDFGKFIAIACNSPSTLNSGIQWMAIGAGDGTLATPAPPSVTDSVLNDEKARKYRDGFTYRNVSNPSVTSDDPGPGTTPTRVFQIAWQFDYIEGNFAIKELGMYANSTLKTDFPAIVYYDNVITSDATHANVIGPDPAITAILASTDYKGILINKKNFPVFTKTSDWKLDITYRVTLGG